MKIEHKKLEIIKHEITQITTYILFKLSQKIGNFSQISNGWTAKNILTLFESNIGEKNLKKIMENTQVKYTMINHLKTTFFILIILFNI